MKPCIAFALGGGGSRGALEVGAMRALLEAGITPDIIVGTSIGAVNAAGLARWGMNTAGIDALENAWKNIAGVQLLDPRMSGLFLRAMLHHPSEQARHRAEKYFVSLGFTPRLTFRQLNGVQVALVSANIETGEPVIYGQNPDDSVLEGLLASIAIPPWFLPLERDGQIMVDGGALSNLPIEPALQLGATEIVAFDLNDPPPTEEKKLGLADYLQKYLFAVSQRHIHLETALAQAKGVPVHALDFRGMPNVPTWDFTHCDTLVHEGYRRARLKIDQWNHEARTGGAFTPVVAAQWPSTSSTTDASARFHSLG